MNRQAKKGQTFYLDSWWQCRATGAGNRRRFGPRCYYGNWCIAGSNPTTPAGGRALQRLTQEEPWAKIPHWVVMHPDLDASAIRVYAVLSKHANKSRHSFPGLIKLAEEARMSKTTVIKALVQLEGAGAVVIKRERMANNRHRVNLYHLPLNRVSPESVPPDVPISALHSTETEPPSSAKTEQELDLKNQLTRELESSNPEIPRLPGESHKDYMLRVASTIPGLDT